MKKTIYKLLLTAICCVTATLVLVGCGSSYEVSLPIGDGRVANDNVTCNYKIAETLTDGYKLEGNFTAESEANLDDNFVLSISCDDRYGKAFNETVLFTFKGKDIADNNGKLKFSVVLTSLEKLFPKTDAPAKFALHFHRENADRTDMIAWNDSSYTYVWNGDKVKIEK